MYRLLEVGEIIRPEDEILCNDGWNKTQVAGALCYKQDVYRRKIEESVDAPFSFSISDLTKEIKEISQALGNREIRIEITISQKME